MDGLLTLQDLFASRAFRIPEYQRGYAWEREQWQDLVEDVELLPVGKEHFTGMIVLQPRPDDGIIDVEGTTHRLFDVVDGQQRLTTLVLFFEAIRRCAPEVLAQGIEKRYIRVIDRAGQPQTKLRFSDGSQPYFVESVLALTPGPSPARTRSQERLRLALDYFERYIAGERARLDGDFGDWLQTLHDRLTQRLRINLYEVSTAADVGMIFEVMNARGRPLTDLDLVKNYILYLGTKLDVPHALHDDVAFAWTQILTGLMAADLGAAVQEDQLLWAHWMFAHDYRKKEWKGSKSVKSTFNLREYVGEHSKLLADLRMYVRTLKDASIAYTDIQRPTRPESFASFKLTPSLRLRVKRAGDRLLRLRALRVFLPLLIAIRLAHPDDGATYCDIVELCECYAFRVYRLLGKRADAGESTLTNLAYRVYHREIDLQETRDELASTLLYYCPDKDFREAFELEDDPTWYGWSGMRYLLYEYEQHLAGSEPVAIPWETLDRLDREKTIEHVLPQTPTDPYWRRRFDEDALRHYTHDLGNLALTADNSSYGKKSFPEKRGDLDWTTPCYATANLRNERELAAWDEWTPETIIERRDRIIVWALERWSVTVTQEPATDVLADAAADEESEL